MTSESFFVPDWPCAAGVRAVATTAIAPGSETAPFNLAAHVDDRPSRVHANRDKLHSFAELPAHPFWLNQVHGRKIVDASETNQTPAADASFTCEQGRVLAVLTADCLPLLIAAKDGRCVAAVHAGWRGLAAGVIEATIARFERANLGASELTVWLGAAISKSAYEVDSKVRDAMLERHPDAARCFEATRPGHWLFDLAGAAQAVLQSRGITDIYGGSLCTYTDKRFFSYRRDSSCGRQATLIWRETGEHGLQ